MITIHCNPYEKGDLLRYLEYAKHKIADEVYEKKRTPGEGEYDTTKINNLIAIINGKNSDDYCLQPKIFREKYGRIKGDNFQEKKREKIEII